MVSSKSILALTINHCDNNINQFQINMRKNLYSNYDSAELLHYSYWHW